MTQLRTIPRSSPEFNSYLEGTFSKTERARFVKTLNPNTSTEQITFEILPMNAIVRPWGVFFLGPLLRFRRLVFILFPFLFVGLNLDQPVFDSTVMILGLISLIFLFWAIYLRNDYTDHMKGLDRIYDRAGSQAIQKGWVTARSVRMWSWGYVIASAVIGLPILVVIPKLAILIFFTGLLLYFSHFRKESFFKTQIWGSWLQGLIIGPLLFVGLELLLSNSMTRAGAGAGIVWGLLVLFVIFIHDFEMLVPNAQAGFHTWISSLGFDRGRQFVEIWWLICLLSFFAFQMLTRHWLVWVSTFFIMIYFSIRFFKNLRQLSTPAGSQVIDLRQEGYQLFVLLVTLWSVQEICIQLFKSIFKLWSHSV